jgi:ATP-dependent exoDNAse (exonuclease V) beta subunit
MHSVFETSLVDNCVDDGLFDIRCYGQSKLEQLSKYVSQLKNRRKDTRPSLGKAVEKQPWRYKFIETSTLPAKTSVTRLTHRSDEYHKFDYSQALTRRPQAVLAAESAESTEGRLVGTATHLVLSKIDLQKNITVEAIEQVIEKLLAGGAMAEAVAGQIDKNSIIRFFESDLGKVVLNRETRIQREWLFTFAVPAAEIISSASRPADDETVIVQGIIDMLVEGPKGLLIIDFKTDRIAAAKAQEQAEIYRQQLQLYGRAAEAVLKTKVCGKWLYFLQPGCAIET